MKRGQNDEEDAMTTIKLAAAAPQRIQWQFPWVFVAVYGVALYFGIA